MLYVDQPIGTGLSYGTEAVASTVGAAPYVWNLLQAFFGLFPQYINREFGLFSESYGGHYGPGIRSIDSNLIVTDMDVQNSCATSKSRTNSSEVDVPGES